MTMMLHRRLGAMEKRMGVTGNPLDQLSDADLDAILEGLHVYLAEQGDPRSIAELAAGDDREARVRDRYEAAGQSIEPREPVVRWPYQRAEALRKKEYPGYRGPRSSRTDNELQQKLNAALAATSSSR